jgi:hypothetical protein
VSLRLIVFCAKRILNAETGFGIRRKKRLARNHFLWNPLPASSPGEGRVRVFHW